jgi:hypothetical protein
MQDELYIIFERYLNHEMSDHENEAFQKRLVEDPNFFTDFDLYKETSTFVQHRFSNQRNDFKTNLKKISNNHFTATKSQKTRVIPFRPIFYAIAAVLALFFGLQLFQNNPTFEEYNQFENAAIGERGDDLVENLKKAEKAFNDKKYKEAIPLLESVLKQTKTDEVAYLYGIALLQENRIIEAEKVFYSLKKENGLYKENATWCLALTKLKEKNYPVCKALLLELSPESDYYEMSRKLLKDLE